MLVQFVLVPLEMPTTPCMKHVWVSKRLVGSRTFFAGDVVPLQFERYLILRQTFRLLQAENFGAPGNPLDTCGLWDD